MANFDAYFPSLLRNEGNYCDNPKDSSGGETYQGIARNKNPNWSGWSIIDAVKKKNGLTSPVGQSHWPSLNAELVPNATLSASVKQLYRAMYWNCMGLDGVHSQSVAEQMADHGVNAGPVRPVKMVQYLLSTLYDKPVATDGVMGPATLAALNSVTPSLFYGSLVEMRKAFYYYLAGAALTSTPHLAGWSTFLGGPSPGLSLARNAVKYGDFLKTWLRRTEVPFVA